MIGDALALLAANGCFLTAGVGVLRLAGGWRGVADLRYTIGVAYVLGVAVIGVVAPLLLIAGLSLAVWQVLVLCAVLFLSGFIADGGDFVRRAPRGPTTKLVVGLVALVLAFLVLLAVDLWFQPLWAWDAWAMWTAKARSIVLLDGLDPGYFASVAPSPEHPLLLPALEAVDFRFMGFNTQILHLQFWLLLTGFVAALAELLRGLAASLALWSTLAALVFAPAVGYQAATAYADVPLAIFFALAAVCAWRWLVLDERTALALLAVFGAATLATKFEGAIYAGALFLTLIALAGRASLRRAAQAGAAGLVALVGVLPWRAWMAANGVAPYHSVDETLEPGVLWARLERVPLALGSLVREIADPTSWVLLAPIAVAAVVLAAGASSERSGVALVVGTATLALAGLGSVYWVTPLPFEFHLSTSAPRVVIGLVLMLGSFTPLLLTEALGAGRRPPQRFEFAQGTPTAGPDGESRCGQDER